jgi:hypothetical protein
MAAAREQRAKYMWQNMIRPLVVVLRVVVVRWSVVRT